MGLYLIGDAQGCDSALGRLLDDIGFSPSRDRIYLLGDLVNRGPESARVLRRIAGYGAAARCVLGNHDLHLLGVAAGARSAGRKDTLQTVLDAPDRAAMLDWLKQQPLAIFEHGWLMVHAGVLPQWSVELTLELAREVEAALRGTASDDFLQSMYGNLPAQWTSDLSGIERLRVTVNALTRLRFCTADGVMEFNISAGPETALPGYLPWFDVPRRKTEDTPIAFGHWSALGYLDRPNLVSLDTGCVWGRRLSALRIGATPIERELFQIDCPGAAG
ncbi:MAG: symmetrical bis(5'-nucleosyl)-tetraphosphatase [Burkholderiales bacterium]